MSKYKIKSLNDILIENEIEISSPIIIENNFTNYYITSFGRIFRIYKDKIRWIKPLIDNSGYYRFQLYFSNAKGDKQRICIMLHRLVAMAFIPNPKNKPEVNHIDLNKLNNKISNLEWCTRSENIRHSYDNNSHKKGEDNSQSIYTEKQIRDVCVHLAENKLCKREISVLTGVSIYTIDAILKNKKWTHISSKYSINYTVKAENTGSTRKCTEEDIVKVCQYIESGKYTMREISYILNVSLYTVQDVKRKRTWVKISKNFNF